MRLGVVRFFALFSSLGVLAACGAGATVSAVPSAAPVDNGIPYADEDETLEDFEALTSEVTIVRHVWEDGADAPRIVIETARVDIASLEGDGPLVNVDPTMTIEMDGETLYFVDGRATDSDGKTWSAYIDTKGEASGTAGFYHYDYGVGASPFDTEGVFAFGFLTDPVVVAARGSTASYQGNWYGYGVVTDGGSIILANEAIGGGSILLTADFDQMSVSGDLTGSYNSFGRVDGSWSELDIVYNGFSGDFLMECGAGDTCRSNTIVGGAFFGAEGGEVSGTIGFDEVRTSSGETRRLVSSAGYTLIENQ